VFNIPCQFFAHTLAPVMRNKPVDLMSIGFLVADLGFLVMRWRLISRFRKIEQIVIVKFKIILNNLCQFFAHTWTTVTFNMHVSFISIGFVVANLGFLVMRWRLISRFQKIKQIVIIKLKIVLNIPRQFFAHTSRTVMLNMHVNFMSIRFLVADLGFRDEDWFRSLSYTNIIKYIPLRPNFSICYSEREDNNESG